MVNNEGKRIKHNPINQKGLDFAAHCLGGGKPVSRELFCQSIRSKNTAVVQSVHEYSD